jgi:hypothetical protein
MNLGAIFLGGYFSYYKVSLSRLRFESFRKGRKILRNHTQNSQICFDFPSVLGFCLGKSWQLEFVNVFEIFGLSNHFKPHQNQLYQRKQIFHIIAKIIFLTRRILRKKGANF